MSSNYQLWNKIQTVTKIQEKTLQQIVQINPVDPFANNRHFIPHIIHQNWDKHEVPQEFDTWIKSWMDFNPTWEYWLWTPDDVRALLKNKYPEYLSLYNKYKFNIFRCDVMRYFIMDTFGGFYVDMDMECLRPLDTWTMHNQCLLSHETYQHPYLLFNKTVPNVVNGILASRPGHPFFKQVIKSLPESFKKFPFDVLQGTGPFFLQRNLDKYEKSNSVLMSQSNVTSHDPNSVTVVTPDVFLPTYDPAYVKGLKDKCLKFGLKDKISKPAKDICLEMKQRDFKNPVNENSYTNHHWVHVFLSEAKWRSKPTVSIFDIVPKCKTYLETL